MQEENQGGNAASIRPDQIHTRRKIPRGEIYGRGTRQSSGSENPKSNKYMETRAPQDIPKKALDRKIKIMLLNSLIRCTVIYGMRTRDLPRHMVGKMEIYMFKQIGAMINPNWKTEAWYPEEHTLPRNTAVGDELMAQQNANRDNDDANARQPSDTHKEP